jgi:aryl-alcohol dehydrogenase-like predicted oxidoreductase
MIGKLVIGTANFGLRYGIANGKKLSPEEVFAILDYAFEQGLLWIDTARAYGDAEQVIGEFFAKRGHVFKVIGKLPVKEYLSARDVEDEIFGSLRNMNIASVDSLLVHTVDTYKQYKNVIVPVLKSLRRDKVIGNYGVSVYHPEEINEIAGETDDRLVFEFPLNLFDQRFLKGGLMEELKSRGFCFFARSVFLQGLFFLGDEALVGRFEAVKGKIKTLRELSEVRNMRPECAALLFAASRPWVDGVVVGVDSLQQLRLNQECFRSGQHGSYSAMEPLLSELAVNDEEIILPYKWNV